MPVDRGVLNPHQPQVQPASECNWSATMSRTTPLILSLSLAFACPVFAEEVETGISSGNLSSVKYLSATATTRRQGARIKDALGSKLGGATQARRVTFEYEDDESGAEFDVRGILLGWKNMRVERYRVADLAEALLLSANQDREDEDARRFIEARGRQVLVLSGDAMDDAALVARVRELAWPASTQKRVDVLLLQDTSDDLFASFSDEAFAASPTFKAKFDEQGDMLPMLAGMDPAAVFTTSGDAQRLETDGSVFTLDGHSMGLYSSDASEAAYGAFLTTVGYTPVAPSASGLSGVLGGAAATVPHPIGAGHDGETFTIDVGDEITIELAGNPTTGYRWRQRGSLTQLTEVDSDFHPGAPGGPVGSGGIFSFEFRATAAGTEDLRLVYSRSSGAPAQTFSVTIVVQ